MTRGGIVGGDAAGASGGAGQGRRGGGGKGRRGWKAGEAGSNREQACDDADDRGDHAGPFALTSFPCLPIGSCPSCPPALPVLPGPASARAGTAEPPAPERSRVCFRRQDLGLLEAPDRDEWNKPDLIMDALGIADGAVVADLGAGGGWLEIRLARRVGPNGLVYAEDIQPQMIEAINRRMQHEGLNNVRTVMGTPTDPRLPAGPRRGPDCERVSRDGRTRASRGDPDAARRTSRGRSSRRVVSALSTSCRAAAVPVRQPEDRVNPDTVIRAAKPPDSSCSSREVVPPFQFLLVFTKASPSRPTSLISASPCRPSIRTH